MRLTKPSEEGMQILFLMQAMINSITPNFRRVTLEWIPPDDVYLRFVLERDDPYDREEVDDIVFEFEALQSEGVRITEEVIVDSRPIEELDLPGRVVFGRKESFHPPSSIDRAE